MWNYAVIPACPPMVDSSRDVIFENKKLQFILHLRGFAFQLFSDDLLEMIEVTSRAYWESMIPPLMKNAPNR